MADDIVINKELLRAIGADTRIAILKTLRERQRTQSELADELKLSAPTILEHLDQLEAAGLVEKRDEGRKWKYYHLTSKARTLVSGTRLNVVVWLAMALLAITTFMVWSSFQPEISRVNMPAAVPGDSTGLEIAAAAPALPDESSMKTLVTSVRAEDNLTNQTNSTAEIP